MESKVKKSYYIWKWIIILTVFAAGWLSGAVTYELSGNGIAKFKGYTSVIYMRDFNRYTLKMLKKYDVNLPETAEFVMGYSTVSRDPSRMVLFTINESDLDSLLGDTWSSAEEDLKDTDILTSYFGLYPYKGVMDNRQWEFDIEMECSLRAYIWVYISRPVDGRVAVAVIYRS